MDLLHSVRAEGGQPLDTTATVQFRSGGRPSWSTAIKLFDARFFRYDNDYIIILYDEYIIILYNDYIIILYNDYIIILYNDYIIILC